MITFNEFKNIVDHINQFNGEVDRVYDLFKIELAETPLVTAGFKLIDDVINSIFTVAGQDIVNQWLFDAIDKTVVITVDGKKKELEDINDIWEFLTSDIKTYFKTEENSTGE